MLELPGGWFSSLHRVKALVVRRELRGVMVLFSLDPLEVILASATRTSHLFCELNKARLLLG